MVIFEKIEDFLSFQLDILFALKIKNPKKHLKPKPKQFYIYCIILNAKGIDISSIDAAEQLRDMMGWDTSNDVYSYRTNLKRQGWLVHDPNTKGGYNIIPMFRNLNTDVKDYKFSIKCTDPILKKESLKELAKD